MGIHGRTDTRVFWPTIPLIKRVASLQWITNIVIVYTAPRMTSSAKPIFAFVERRFPPHMYRCQPCAVKVDASVLLLTIMYILLSYKGNSQQNIIKALEKQNPKCIVDDLNRFFTSSTHYT